MINFFSIIAGVYVVDLLSKTLIRQNLPRGAEVALMPFFSLVHVENTGVAFGMGQGKNLIFLVLGLGVVAVLFFLGLRSIKEDRTMSYLLALVIGGALGNLTDRLFFGRVTDFLDVYVGRYHWPAFNVADSAICIGTGLLIWRNLKK